MNIQKIAGIAISEVSLSREFHWENASFVSQDVEKSFVIPKGPLFRRFVISRVHCTAGGNYLIVLDIPAMNIIVGCVCVESLVWQGRIKVSKNSSRS